MSLFIHPEPICHSSKTEIFIHPKCSDSSIQSSQFHSSIQELPNQLPNQQFPTKNSLCTSGILHIFPVSLIIPCDFENSLCSLEKTKTQGEFWYFSTCGTHYRFLVRRFSSSTSVVLVFIVDEAMLLFFRRRSSAHNLGLLGECCTPYKKCHPYQAQSCSCKNKSGQSCFWQHDSGQSCLLQHDYKQS